MPSDRARPSVWRQAQERELVRYVRRELYPYSSLVRSRMDEARVGPGDIRRTADLGRIPLTRLADVDDPALLLLRPEERSLRTLGEPRLAWSVTWAKLRGRAARANAELIDPVYKPVHWHLDGSLPIASSAEDVERLADKGRRLLGQAGLHRYDVLVNLLPPGPSLAFWQLALGAREGGLSALHLDRPPMPAELEAWAPTVLAGRAADLAAALRAAAAAGRVPRELRMLLVVGDRLDADARGALAALAPRPADTAVVCAWAPPGVRALWGECRGGDSFHTWPDSEVVEVVDGEVVWTAVGWKGSALARLATGVQGALDDATCPVCGRTTPRLVVAPPPAPAPTRRRRAQLRAAGAGNGRRRS